MEDAQKDHEEAEKQRASERAGYDKEINEAKRKDSEREKRDREEKEKEEKEKQKQAQEEETARTQQQKRQDKNVTQNNPGNAPPPKNNTAPEAESIPSGIQKLQKLIAKKTNSLAEQDKATPSEERATLMLDQETHIGKRKAQSEQESLDYRRRGLMKETELKR